MISHRGCAMETKFAQFCGAEPAFYQALRRRVDLCGQSGRSYEFSPCELPTGCAPRYAALGFARREDGAYLLYWRPAVRYGGADGVLRALFARSVWRFDSYELLSARLRTLRPAGELSAAVLPAPEPSPAPRAQPSPAPQPMGALFPRLVRELGARVLGQERAVEAAAFRLCAHVGKSAPARPLSLILYGPTGVGKSELAKAVAPALERCGGPRYQTVWTELNTFTQPHSVHRLIGAPPGYVGYDDPPIFEAVRENARTVFLFDELDKAHPEVLKMFLSVLDEGRITACRPGKDGQRELDFRQCIFVFTSNADLTDRGGRRMGFSADGPRQETAAPATLAERLYQENESARRAMVRQGVLSEIAGRFTGLIGFQPLTLAARRDITRKQLRALGREYGVVIADADPATVAALTPEAGGLSVRSSVAVLEGLLAPLLSPWAGSGAALRLSGRPDALGLTPVQGAERLTSSTSLVSTFSR